MAAPGGEGGEEAGVVGNCDLPKNDMWLMNVDGGRDGDGGGGDGEGVGAVRFTGFRSVGRGVGEGAGLRVDGDRAVGGIRCGVG